MKKVFKFKYFIRLAVMLMVITGIDVHAKTYKIATDIQANGTAGRLLNEFKINVERRTNERVTFKIFFGGVLGDQLQYFQHLQRGVIDICLINSASLESVIPTVGVMNMPYLFRSADEYELVMTNPDFRSALFNLSSKHRFAFLGFISSDFRSIYSTHPIRTVKDLKGQRLRTISSQTYVEMLTRFGAIPSALPFGELYSAMQQGVVDGAEGGIAGLYEARFSDIAKYVVLTEHTRLTDFVLSSMDFQRELSSGDLAIVNEEFEKISLKSIKYADTKEREYKERAIIEAGVQFFEVDKTPLIEAVKPMYKNALEDAEKSTLLKTILSIEKRVL